MSGGFVMRTRREGLGRTLDETVRQFHRRFEMGKIGLRVGVRNDATQQGTSTPLAVIAEAHEFGTEDGHIPERSFMRGGVRDRLEDIKRMQRINLKAIANDKITPHAALTRLGGLVVGAIQAYIRKKPFQVLADTTLRARERAKGKASGVLNADNTTPLVVDGDLINGITFEVYDK